MLSTIIGLDDESFSFALRFDATRGIRSSHEVRHVYQYEQAGSIARFLPVYLRQGSNAQRELRPATPLAAEQAFHVVSGFFLGRWARRHLPKIF